MALLTQLQVLLLRLEKVILKLLFIFVINNFFVRKCLEGRSLGGESYKNLSLVKHKSCGDPAVSPLKIGTALPLYLWQLG